MRSWLREAVYIVSLTVVAATMVRRPFAQSSVKESLARLRSRCVDRRQLSPSPESIRCT